MTFVLYNQCRSGPSYRVRIALNWKDVEFKYVAVNLAKNAQRTPAYLELNLQGLVPTLDIGGRLISQSSAIIEWLEEQYPYPPLLPAELPDRAVARAMAAVIGSDIQPLNNLRIQDHLRSKLNANQGAVREWVFRWIAEGFEAYEMLARRYGNGFSLGDQPTIADVYLIPQVTTAERAGFDVSPYPCITAIFERAIRLPAFLSAKPDRQPDWN